MNASLLPLPAPVLIKALRNVLAGSCLAALAACGGGGGGGSSGSKAPTSAPQLGLVKLTVKDELGATIAGVTIQGTSAKATTDAQGVALVSLPSPTASEMVSLSRDSFMDTSVTITSTAGQVNEQAIVLTRQASPAGGSLSTRSGTPPTVDPTGQRLSFEIELIIVDSKSQPVTSLTTADFLLRACTPDAGTPTSDCVASATGAADAAYTPNSAQPEALTWIDGRPKVPYAVALLLDQSGSITATDPTGARIFSTKTFLKGLGPQDQALLSTFAGTAVSASPLTVYGPFRDQAGATTAYFSTLDALALQVGGATPLYDSLDGLRQQLAGSAAPPAGLAKAIVVLTDGADTTCGTVDACRLSRQRTIDGARQDGVPIVTIGLSHAIDVAALGDLANQTGGAFLYAENTQQLLSLYGTVGALLSQSQPTYRLRWTAVAAAPGTFHSGDSLLGRVQVKVGQGSFDVPFVVGIP
ncbi:VWA domain-containing protein [Burkholderiaceae bacterium UC74_6]